MKITNKKQLLNVLVYSILISYIIHLFLLFFVPSTHQWNIFFADGKDLLADFFNIARFSANKDVYLNPKGLGYTCYLPLSYMLLYPFIWLVDFNNMTLQECWLNPQAMICAFIFIVISIILFVHSLCCFVKKYNLSKLILIPLFISNLLFFSVERGNWIIVTAAFMYYFIAFYESDNKKERYFAATCLVIASVLKVYPVFLGIIYIQKKDFKIIVYCFILGIILTFLPFLTFKSGFRAIPTFLETLKWNSKTYAVELNPKFGLPYLCYWFGKALEKLISAPDGISNLFLRISSILIRVICVYAIILSFKVRKIFYKFLLIIMAALYFPAHSEYYCGLYLFPIILLFFSEEENFSRIESVIFLIFSIVLLQNIQIVYAGWFNITRIIVDVVSLMFFIYELINISIITFLKEGN